MRQCAFNDGIEISLRRQQAINIVGARQARGAEGGKHRFAAVRAQQRGLHEQRHVAGQQAGAG